MADMNDEEKQNAAAAKIQAMQRGKQGRREVEAEKASIAKIQAIHRGKAARRAMAVAEEAPAAAEEVAAATALLSDSETGAADSLFAALTLDADGKASCADILGFLGGSVNGISVPLEAWVAGVKSTWTEMLGGIEGDPAEVKFTKEEFVLLAGRSVAFVAEDEAAEAAEATGGDAEAVAFEGTDEEVAAAAKIQAMHRGKQARAEKNEMAAASVKIQANFRGRIVRGERERQEQSAAAVKIQAVHRGKAARKGAAAGDASAGTIEAVVAEREAEADDLEAQRASATKIQAIHRGKQGRARVAGMKASGLKIQFIIMPENFTYELECPAGATWAETKAALETELSIKQANMRIRVDGKEVADDTAMLEATGVVNGMTLDLEVVYAESAPMPGEPIFEGEAMIVTVDRADGSPPQTVRVYIDKAEMKPKPYLGGFRNKKSSVEYHHAFTQTPPDAQMIARAEEAAKKIKVERNTQTVVQKSRSAMTVRETATQMNPPYLPLLVDESNDKVLEPRPYYSADQVIQKKDEKTRVIQNHVRGWFARRVAAELRRQLLEQQQFIQQQAELRAKEAEEARRKEIERRMHPRTPEDFEVLHKELEAWRLKETAKIQSNGTLDDDEKQAELEVLLGKETQLLQTIDRLKIAAAHENKTTRTSTRLNSMSKPKSWALSDGEAITVHTPFTSRARELKELYNGLELRGISVDERLDVLLHVKWTVTEFDCPLTRDVVQLIDREADMLNRGRSEKSLDSLRQRLSNLFLHFLMTPEFNPEASRFQKVPPEYQLNSRTRPIQRSD